MRWIMLKSELYEILANLENSGIEFKGDDIRQKLIKELIKKISIYS